jgi:hypothetical protein
MQLADNIRVSPFNMWHKSDVDGDPRRAALASNVMASRFG